MERALSALNLPPEWRVKVEVRPRRRTLGIEVGPNGTVVLAVPADVDEREVAALLKDNTHRVARAVRLRAADRAEHPVKELADGEHFAYLGRTFRLRLLDHPDGRVRLAGGWLEVSGRESVAATTKMIIDWYATRGDRWCREHLKALAGRAGVTPPLTTVRDLPGRWGERRADGSIALHWAVMQLPASLIELVLAHELVHLKSAKHSSSFRTELAMLVPGLEPLERRLAEESPSVWLGRVRGAVDAAVGDCLDVRSR